MSSFFNLNKADIVKGLALAVIVAFLGAIQQGLTAQGFDFAAYDWQGIFNITVTAFVGYLTKNILTTENGKVLGKIG